MCMSKSPADGLQPKICSWNWIKIPPISRVEYTKMDTKYMSQPPDLPPHRYGILCRGKSQVFTGSCDDGAFPAPSNPPERSKKTFHESWWLQLDISCTRDMWWPIPWNSWDGGMAFGALKPVFLGREKLHHYALLNCTTFWWYNWVPN